MTSRRARTAVAGAVVTFAIGYAALGILRHRAFGSGRFDLGNMTQAVWSTAHGRPLEATSLAGEQFVRLGAHFDPLLALLAPLWLLWPDPELLLVIQAAGLALGAVPVFLLARKHLHSERAAALFAIAYLLSPWLGWIALADFHAVALATPLLLGAWWFLDEEQLLPFAVCAVLAVATKEHVGLVVAGMGLWHALSRRRPLPGLSIAAAGAAVAVLAVTVVAPHYSPAGSSTFFGRYDAIGGSAGGIARTALRHPLRIAGEATEQRDGAYLLKLAAPVAGLGILAPAALMPALPEIALNVLSGARTQTSIRYHYSAASLAVLVAAAIFGASRVVRRGAAPAALGGVALAAAVAGSYALGPLPVWRALPGGAGLPADTFRVTEHDRAAAAALRLIPASAAVSASNSLGAHLSERRRVLSFPRLLDARWVAVDETSPGYLDRFAPRPYARAIARLRRDRRWLLVHERDGVLVFRRR